MNNVNRLFNAVGFTDLSGTVKVTFVTDPFRKRKHAATTGYNLRIVDLPEAMNRVAALQYALTHPDFQTEADQLMLHDNLDYQQQVVTKADPNRPRQSRGRPRQETDVTLRPSLDVIRARMVRPAQPDVTVADVLRVINEPVAE